MIWAVLALLGVPLWFCALAVVVLVLRNRALRLRPGDISVRAHRSGRSRWTRVHAIWVSDVFAWRGRPAAWKEELDQVRSVRIHVPDSVQRKKLRRLGADPAVAELSFESGGTLFVAAPKKFGAQLLGPFAREAAVREGIP